MPTESPRRSWLYRLTIPWIWLITAFISWRNPGDEYGLLVVANGLPSALISVFFFGETGSPQSIFATMITFSLAAMLLISWTLDALRVPLRAMIALYLLGTVFLVYWAISSYESYARAIAKNGSLAAYLSAGSNLSLFLTAVFLIIVFAIWRLVQTWRRPPVAS